MDWLGLKVLVEPPTELESPLLHFVDSDEDVSVYSHRNCKRKTYVVAVQIDSPT